ncbi:Putative tryptophan synthase beta chain-like, PALP domain-containing protein [Colletotrichum destructivum]|uniref:Tryptophan synthase beta chain-like, PALP domain-containing protein n=1 Tax=Colletotrichum destructivum TaxID=34406 RepID=A0AAX4IUD5_9PEZI|nr:Putative tryptophan synthase beta chain-like, PALP domain-containing protein [Colletotrichum destructivum]
MAGTRAPPPVDTVLDAIGNTPCVRLRRMVPEGCADVYVKLESLNPTGSYKDRLARAIIEEAERRGDIRPGSTVVEATGGSTGSSLAFVCSLKGYRFVAVCSNAFAREKLRTMAAFGAVVENVHSPDGKITPELFASIVGRAKTIVAENEGHYAADQFNNRDCIVGYRTLGEELVAQFPQGIDAFCAAIGGAGMAMGTSTVLKATRPSTRVVVLEPASAPLLTQGKGGTHGIEGIGPGFVPPLLDRALYDEVRAYPEQEAREMCRRLAKEEGILAGTSTGLNVVAALALAKELGPGKVVVTVACDTGLKYTSGNLYE